MTQKQVEFPEQSHYPNLRTVLMVEEFVRKHDGEYGRKALWENLPKKTMYQTFKTIIDYLSYSNKISIDADGKVGWIFYSEAAKTRSKKKNLSWRNSI